jgi:hypothetical protein
MAVFSDVFSGILTLEDGIDRWSRNYYSRRNKPVGRSSYLFRGGSLKSRVLSNSLVKGCINVGGNCELLPQGRDIKLHFMSSILPFAETGGRAVQGGGLQPLACCDYRFESRCLL